MKTSRRAFLVSSASLLGGCSLFNIGYTPARRPAASERIALGVIGCGGMGWWNTKILLADPRVQVTVVCDVVAGNAQGKNEGGFYGYEWFRAQVDKYYGKPGCRVTPDWREVVNDPTIDAVLIATSDHWHAKIAKEAMLKGKHVYCQKPLTLGINEGRELVRVAKMTGVTFQVGNQGRSESVKRVAAEIVRNGYLGECRTACVRIPGGPDCKYVGQRAKSTARGKVPGFFTPEGWKMYLGPSQHWEDDAYIPAIHDAQVWRCNCRTGNGITPDFGAHDVDTVQWAFGVDRSGPVAIENARFSDWLEPREILSWANTFSFDLVYADGRRCHVKSYDPKHGEPRSVTFNGSVGTLVEGLYSGQPVKLQLPPALKKWREKTDLKGSDIRFHAPKDGHPHEQDFIDGIYGGATSTDCEIGHRTTSACLLATICQRLGVSRLEWDPVNEVFTGAHAAEANKLLDVPYLNGWSL